MSSHQSARLSVERTLTRDDFVRFAQISGDNNPIHIDETFSGVTKFGKPVAHGMLLFSLVNALAAPLIGDRIIAEHQLQFSNPALEGDRLNFAVWADWEDGADMIKFDVTRADDQQSVCAGSAQLRSAEHTDA